MGSYAAALQHKQALSDEEHEQLLSDHNSAIHNIQQKMSTVGPDDPAYAGYQNQLSTTIASRAHLFHPDQPGGLERLGKMLWQKVHGAPNPNTETSQPAESAGIVPTAMGASTALPAATGPVIAHPPATAGEAKAQVGQIAAWAAPPSPVNPFAQKRAQLAAGGFTPEQVDHAMSVFAGIEAKPVADKPTRPMLKEYKLKDGTMAWLDASTPEDIPEGAQPTAGQPHPSTSKFATDRATWAASHNTTPEKMTWTENAQFEREEWKNNNPLGPARFGLQREGLDFRESQGDLSSFLHVTKALQPLDRLVQVGKEAQQDVLTPTGPGDVALTLAFFDAIKTQGVRFTKQENDLINNSRGFMEGVQAKYDGGFNGTAFGPAGSPQRAIIAEIVKKGAEAAKSQKSTIQSGAGRFRPKVAAALTGAPEPAAKHKIKIGQKFYTYNGTGDTGDIKNYTEVPK